jgi:DNA repair photolyase
MITRKILEKLIDIQPVLGIQTKSDLITRDIDILKRIKNCTVGLTITSDKNEDTKIFEPKASNVDKRIRTLEILNKNRINTYVFIGPILPYITDWKRIINKTKKYSKSFMFENANLHGTIWKDVKDTIRSNYTYLSKKYDDFYLSRVYYWEKAKNKILEYCKNKQLVCKIYFDHKKIRKK